MPWLAGAVLIGFLNVAVMTSSGAPPGLSVRATLALGFCASLVMAGFVAARSNRESARVERQERERPAADELSDRAEGRRNPDVGPSTYVESMDRWAAAMLELTDHAVATGATDPVVAVALTAAAEDTRALRDLLSATAAAPPSAGGMATVHSLCTMWEADQVRVEQLSAHLDTQWYRRWRARSVVERLVREGGRTAVLTTLPYGT